MNLKNLSLISPIIEVVSDEAKFRTLTDTINELIKHVNYLEDIVIEQNKKIEEAESTANRAWWGPGDSH